LAVLSNNRLNNVDLPEFGGPTIDTINCDLEDILNSDCFVLLFGRDVNDDDDVDDVDDNGFLDRVVVDLVVVIIRLLPQSNEFQ
jgi:hypothetical protein